MRMGGIGRAITGGRKNKAKKIPKWVSWACFGMHGHGQETHHVGGGIIVAYRESNEAKKGEQGLRCLVSMYFGTGKTRKRTGGQKKKVKQGHTEHATQGQKYKNK